MATELNGTGKRHMLALVGAGKVNADSPWSFSASDGDALLGANGADWALYGSWHLGHDPTADPHSKAAYKYPFGKDGKVYRSALRAIRSRAGQQNDTAVGDAARQALDEMDKQNSGSGQNADPGITEWETRNIQGIEMRIDAGRPPRLIGYAAVFNSKSSDLGNFIEIVRPGAFGQSLKQSDVRALHNHDPNRMLGRTSAGTLILTEDERGLRAEIHPPNTDVGRDVMENVRLGNLDGMSFGFRTIQHRWAEGTGPAQPPLRELLEVDLFDVSVVTFPAYPKTDVALRSLEQARSQWEQAQREAQRLKMETARRWRRLDAIKNP